MICETSFASVLCGEPPGSVSRFDSQAGQGACPVVYHHNQNLAHKARNASLLVLGILLPPPCLLGLCSSRGGPTYLGRRWCGQGQGQGGGVGPEVHQPGWRPPECEERTCQQVENLTCCLFLKQIVSDDTWSIGISRIFTKSRIVATIHWAMWTLTTGKTGRAG